MSANRAFPFVRVNERQSKPRTQGVTEIRGPYYTPLGVRYLEDLLETVGDHVDERIPMSRAKPAWRTPAPSGGPHPRTRKGNMDFTLVFGAGYGEHNNAVALKKSGKSNAHASRGVRGGAA